MRFQTVNLCPARWWRLRGWPALLVVCALNCAASGAGQKPGASDRGVSPVWPPSPAEPRIAYIQSISGPDDIGQTPSVWKRVSGLLSGTNPRAEGFVKPFGVALDEKGNLCVTDTGVGAVFYCDFAHKRWLRFTGSGKTRFTSPVAVARKAGIFYVADSELARVFAFRDENAPVFEISQPLERPTGLALGGEKLFVADSQAHLIRVFDLQGHFHSQFGERGSAPGEFNFPTHLSTDANGRLYVTDSMNGRIQVFDNNGTLLRVIGSPGDTSGHFGRPKGAAVDNEGRVYAVDALFDAVQIFDGESRFLLDWGSAGSAPGEFWLPNGIAISAGNRIFVSDTFNRRVQVFDYVGQP